MSENENNIFGLLLKIAMGIFAVFFILPIALTFLFYIVDDFQISINQKTAKAEVFSIEDEWEERNDGRTMVQVFYFDYNFQANGEQYVGRGESQGTPPPNEIEIAYDSNNPNNNRVKIGSFYRYMIPPIKLILLLVSGFFLLRFLIIYIKENYYQFEIVTKKIRFKQNLLGNSKIQIIILIFTSILFSVSGLILGDNFTKLNFFNFPHQSVIFIISLIVFISFCVINRITQIKNNSLKEDS
jgi:hypothetical protein